MAIYTKSGDYGETSLLGGGRTSKGSWLIGLLGFLDELNSNLGLVTAMTESILNSQGLNVNRDDRGGKIEVGLASLIGQLRDIQRDLLEMGSMLASQTDFSVERGRDLSEASSVVSLKARETQRMAESFLNKGKGLDLNQQGARLASEVVNRKENGSKTVRFDVRRLERLIDEMERDLPRLQNFILPGGGVTGAQIMVTRSVCRRVEREFVRYFQSRKKRLARRTSSVGGRNLSSRKKTELVDDAKIKKGSFDREVLTYLNRLSDYLFVSARWVNWLMEEDEVVWRRKF